jgi:hypothetical protein
VPEQTDIRPQPKIRAYCRRCARTLGYERPEQYAVVSPDGVAHIGADYGRTACGVDATRDPWWWPL